MANSPNNPNDPNWAKYIALAHAMQTGVAFKMSIDPKETTPKHLRTGVNAAMSDHGALVKLLIAKGLFTEEEYLQAITDQMAEEVKGYEEYLAAQLGSPVKLG